MRQYIEFETAPGRATLWDHKPKGVRSCGVTTKKLHDLVVNPPAEAVTR